ncbi:MAG: TylF/MycF family methyltransferase [Acidobacteria bacterium]|nr:TylF/MycF family methyltransferase [Acidobacteriota bacterium]MCA1651260.1 TylF/MycF family methyltransferase [Acidobacteriota bacterium]
MLKRILIGRLHPYVKRFAPRLLRPFGYQLQPVLPLDISPEEHGVWKAVWPYTMTSQERVVSLVRAIRYVTENRIPGAIVECGVWKGGSMMATALTLQTASDIRDLYLFDTFEGMTAPTENDVRYDGKPATGLMAAAPRTDQMWAVAGLEEVERNMTRTGYPPERIHYIKGRVEQTVPAQVPCDEIALLRLDTDWYESTRHELLHLYPRVVSGGVVIFDDYFHYLGQRQAVDEYFNPLPRKPFLSRIDYTGRLLVKP